MDRRGFIRLLSGGVMGLGLGGCVEPGYRSRSTDYYYSDPLYEYYYYPDVNVYYHINTGYYYYRDGGYWRHSHILPRRYRLNRARRTRIFHREPRPYEHNHEHRSVYERQRNSERFQRDRDRTREPVRRLDSDRVGETPRIREAERTREIERTREPLRRIPESRPDRDAQPRVRTQPRQDLKQREAVQQSAPRVRSRSSDRPLVVEDVRVQTPDPTEDRRLRDLDTQERSALQHEHRRRLLQKSN